MTREEETALCALKSLISVMEMQEKRETGEFHITQEVMRYIWDIAKSTGRLAIVSIEGKEAIRLADEAAGNELAGFTACIVSE